MTPRQPDIERQFDVPTHTIAHISDTHFVESGRLRDQIDCDDQLERLFNRIEDSGRSPDALVFTGDLTDDGSSDAYARLRKLVEPTAERWGAEVVWVMGNHDSRPMFREHLLDEAESSAPIDFVRYLGGLRIVVLDTTIPGFHHGEIGDRQLNWLRRTLQAPAPDGTLLAMHHPPIPTAMELLEVYELKEQHRLQSVLVGTDVRAVFAGHFHFTSTSTIAGIPVSVASATCYTQDLIARQRGVRGIDGGRSFNLVHVFADRIVHSVVPLEGVTLYEKPESVAHQQMRETDAVRLAAGAAARGT